MGHPGENRAAGSQNLVFREQLELEIICNSSVRAKTMRCERRDSATCTLLKSRGKRGALWSISICGAGEEKPKEQGKGCSLYCMHDEHAARELDT